MKIDDFERVCEEHDRLTERVSTLSAQLAEAQAERERMREALRAFAEFARAAIAKAEGRALT